MKHILECFLFFLISVSSCSANLKKMQTVFQWKYVDYVWPSEEYKQAAIANGDYDYKNVIPMDFAVARGTNIFNFLILFIRMINLHFLILF